MTAMRNKTDKPDARAIANLMRAGWFRHVHIKSEESYRLRFVLTQRDTSCASSSISKTRSGSR